MGPYTIFDKLTHPYENFTNNSNSNSNSSSQSWILFNSLFNSMLSQINLVNSLTYDSTHEHCSPTPSLFFYNFDPKLANLRSILAISSLPIQLRTVFRSQVWAFVSMIVHFQFTNNFSYTMKLHKWENFVLFSFSYSFVIFFFIFRFETFYKLRHFSGKWENGF